MRRFTSQAVFLLIPAILFAVPHLTNLEQFDSSPYVLLPYLVDGLAFGWVAYRTGSLWMSLGIHWSNNLSNVVLVGPRGDVLDSAAPWQFDIPNNIAELTIISVVTSVAMVAIVRLMVGSSREIITRRTGRGVPATAAAEQTGEHMGLKGRSHQTAVISEGIDDAKSSARRAAADNGLTLDEAASTDSSLTLKKSAKPWSWGSTVVMDFEDVGDGKTQVSVSTQETFAATDWGRGREARNKLFEDMGHDRTEPDGPPRPCCGRASAPVSQSSLVSTMWSRSRSRTARMGRRWEAAKRR